MMHGPLGVSLTFEIKFMIRGADSCAKEEQIYVSDPRALHYITIKEQNIYDEVPGFYA